MRGPWPTGGCGTKRKKKCRLEEKFKTGNKKQGFRLWNGSMWFRTGPRDVFL